MITDEGATSFFDIDRDLSLTPNNKRLHDYNAKNILKYREVLARIVHYTLTDFKDMSIEEIGDSILADPANEQFACIKA